jgi:sugar phosphate isomerase/epimerase
MALITRREAGKLMLTGCAGAMMVGRGLDGAAKVNSVFRGVQIGAQSYSFRDRPLDACIDAFRECGLGECELSEVHVQPASHKYEDLKKWRIETPLSVFKETREKFDRAGILLFAYTCDMQSRFTDEELDRCFQMAQALRVKYITSSANISAAPRIDKLAQKYKIMVGFHGHDQTSRPDDFSSPETFEKGLKGASKYLGINLDIGHFVAAGGDPVAFLKEHHQQIVCLHIKDRKKNHGANVPFGQGETPIVEVLRMVRDNHWKFPANIEYEYGKENPGLDTIAEVKKCVEFCKKALEG